MKIEIRYSPEEAKELNKALEKVFIPVPNPEKYHMTISRHTFDGQEYDTIVNVAKDVYGDTLVTIEYPKELSKVLSQKVLMSNKLQKRIRDVRDLFRYNYCPPDLYSDEDNYLPKYPKAKEDKEKAGYRSCIAESEEEKK